ncbi:lysophospholipid acyltransferase family protein [Rhodophyticola porphyridii]|uniref:DUF374 domain-containing protein n=1 Tax=Rhodophyticola porphyridii TaxID=1852017 RepID=A0A3L9YCF0_9RHOB|nr:DUF374 domain-containing protein [Rhodophyticola porphyridii]RMA40650.1 DUF374 domain-containing protein [Rhodophyticola porphyridii]
MSLRKRIADAPRTNRAVAALFGGYMRFVRASSRRNEDGWEAVSRALDSHGAVLIVCWHQRLMLTPWMFDLTQAPCRSLTSDGRAGRLVGWIHRAFGYETMPMKRGLLGAGAIREVLRGLQNGISIGISPDGPQGPPRVAKVTPIQWARATQIPVFVFTFSARRYLTWPTWDRLMFPMPFTRLELMWRQWDRVVPRRVSADQAEALAADLGRFMNAVSAECDARAGHDTPQL